MLSRRTLVALAASALALAPGRAGAQTYRWIDDTGVVHYSQGLDSVPERYRDPRLSPRERSAALEAVAALRDLEAKVAAEIGRAEYEWRLRRLDEVVPKALRALRRGPVASALGGALAHYRAAGRLVEGGAALSRERLVGADPRCPRLARLPAPRERVASAEERAAALQAVWGCASDRIARAEALTLRPGAGPWAERVPAPPKPRPRPSP